MTEKVSMKFSALDDRPLDETVRAMVDDQLSGVAAIGERVKAISRAARAAANRLIDTGRLVYVGAGTSGRLAVLDGVELGPTYGWPDERLRYCIAGGVDAVMRSAEGAEDMVDDAVDQLRDIAVCSQDVVIAIAASGNTPFTVGAARSAREAGALTIAIANTASSRLEATCEHHIIVETGSEVIAGSSRMKAGTAQKAVLSMLSTAIMISLDRTYGGLMVNMVVSNKKLRARAERIVSSLAGVSKEKAAQDLDVAENDIRTAILLGKGLDLKSSRNLLSSQGGSLRRALGELLDKNEESEQ